MKKTWRPGAAHPDVQKFVCEANTLAELMRVLPEEANPIRNWKVSGAPTAQNVLSWFRNDQHVAFYGPGSKDPLSYADLKAEIQAFAGYQTKPQAGTDVMVVALILPPRYMAQMAVTLVTLLAEHHKGIAIAPLDANMPHEKLLAALRQLRCSGLVTTPEIYDKLKKTRVVAKNIQDIRLVEPNAKENCTGLVDWNIVKQGPLVPAYFPNMGARPALLLRTSGTTAEPKIVPITASALLFNATTLASSLGLQTKDIGVNVMPLHHIGGIVANLFAVLVSGSSMIMVPGSFDPDVILDVIVGKGNTNNDSFLPTWYYSVPALHKVILMSAKARLAAASSATATSKKQHHIPNGLRFIRNGGAHLKHQTALELASLFQTQIIQTYSMTEAMPICSNQESPIVVDNGNEVIRAGVPKDTVGLPYGVSIAVVDRQGKTLPYGTVGEICIKGPGVMHSYVGVDRSLTHTYDGHWLRTGDMGQMDQRGHIVLAGRAREMIKRGLEQVWPNEVDEVIESLPEVAQAITFGVKNELWGEEVQVAVVLEDPNGDKIGMSSMIAKRVEESLGAYAKPAQVLYLESADFLLRSSSGKILRSRIAEQLEVEATDTVTLKALEAMAKPYDDMMEARKMADDMGHNVAKPSSALNGVRFLAVCYVVQHRAGLMPTTQWLKVQAYSASAMIFFILAAFQTTVSAKSAVKPNGAKFVGIKIGTLQPLFIVAHAIAIGSYLAFHCGEEGYQEKCEGRTCSSGFQQYFPLAFMNMFSGFFTKEYLDNSNPTAWFQMVLYLFYMAFPIFDSHLRRRTLRYRIILLVICLLLGSSAWVLMLDEQGRNLVNNAYFYERFASWIPNFLAAMIAGFIYKENGPREKDDDEEEETVDVNAKLSKKFVSEEPQPLLQRPGFWGCITDVVSFFLLIISLAIGGAPDCVQMSRENFEQARPDVPIFADDILEVDGVEYLEACDVTRDEFIQYGWTSDINDGKWNTTIGFLAGDGRFIFPLVLIWIYGMAYGQGCTANIFRSRIMQFLAPFAYPVYLLHVPVLRFYWVATRGLSAEFWWDEAGRFPFPVDAWEVFVIILICAVLGGILNKFVAQPLIPICVRAYVKAYKFLVSCLSPRDSYSGSEDIDASQSVVKQVSLLIETLTGTKMVKSTMKLNDLGFDSMGSTALLGTLKSSVPAARGLTMAQLAGCETVGDLVFLLEGRD